MTERISRGSDSELAYASPVVSKLHRASDEDVGCHERKCRGPRALNDEAGDLGPDDRKRRSGGSSRDERCCSTTDGLWNEDLRVGGPYLCASPVETKSLPGNHAMKDTLLRTSSNGDTLRQRIEKILGDHNISHQSIDLVERRSRRNPEPKPILTVLIKAPRVELTNSWLTCVREIRKLLQHENFAQVPVEIEDPQANYMPKTSPVLKSDKLFHKMVFARGAILIKREFTEITSVECVRRGRHDNPNENPPTMLITVRNDSRKDWRNTRDLVVLMLNKLELPMVAVEITKDEVHSTSEKHDRGKVLGKSGGDRW